jgi:hypothetical protein
VRKRVRERKKTNRLKNIIQKIDTTQGGFAEVVQAFFANQIHIVYVHQEELYHKRLLIVHLNVIHE